MECKCDSSQNGRYAVKNNIWNQDIPVGGSVTFGLTCIFKEDRNEPDGFMLATDWIEASEESYSYKTEFNTTGDDSFYDAVLILQNESNEIIEDWCLSLKTGAVITEVYNGIVVKKTENIYLIKNAEHNQNIGPGESLRINLQGTKPEGVEEDLTNIILYKTVFDESCLTKEIPGTGDQDVSGGNGDVSGNNEDVSGGNGDVSGNNEDVSGGNSDVSGKDVMDTDQDGITDEMELTIGWDPLNPDTDGDGIPDGYAMHVLYPLLLHYGFDEERGILASDDYDSDGLTNLDEYIAGTSSGATDTDDDGLSDYEEIYEYRTNPFYGIRTGTVCQTKQKQRLG